MKRALLTVIATTSCCWAQEAIDQFLAKAQTTHGAEGLAAAKFLVEHMPAADKSALGEPLLSENLDLAFQARETFPWAKDVPEEIFRNDVLPYAVFDETREPWRKRLLEIATPIVKDSKSATEAAQALNQHLFNKINVHYNTGRKRPNQSLAESEKLTMATCTGLSIILVDACRAVGVPARAVGTPMWSNGRGNHTWVEIWDGDWHFLGADEFDANGLNRGWFAKDASEAQADSVRHAIYATSWQATGTTFPLVWDPSSRSVNAVNVTTRYTADTATESSGTEGIEVAVRLFDQPGGERISAPVAILDPEGKEIASGTTKAGTTDLNDMPRFHVPEGATVIARFTHQDEVREIAIDGAIVEPRTIEPAWSELEPVSPARIELEKALQQGNPFDGEPLSAEILDAPLSKSEADRAATLLADAARKKVAQDQQTAMENRVVTKGDLSMRWLEETFGEEPEGGHSLWISMHGGGGAPAQVNDQQWRNQIRLYTLKEGIYIAPRAPTDTWNLWHEGHIDDMFDQIIQGYVALRGVNPEKIYLLGYSAGGDGVWQLAPRMADRFAAAAMMAGHPNTSTLTSLRNLPFAIFMGGKDAAYDRNKIAAEKAKELAALHQADPGGYVHFVRIYEDLGHWMNGKDAEGLPWMAGFNRDSWPDKIVWEQASRPHQRFYWLETPQLDSLKPGERIDASIVGQTIRLDGKVPAGLKIRLSDQLLDLDQQVELIVNGESVSKAQPIRTARSLVDSLSARLDLPAAASATIQIP